MPVVAFEVHRWPCTAVREAFALHLVAPGAVVLGRYVHGCVWTLEGIVWTVDSRQSIGSRVLVS